MKAIVMFFQILADYQKLKLDLKCRYYLYKMEVNKAYQLFLKKLEPNDKKSGRS